MSTIRYTVEVVMVWIRCSNCSQYWGREEGKYGVRCPYCADNRIDELCAETESLKKTISGYKAAITRRKSEQLGQKLLAEKNERK